MIYKWLKNIYINRFGSFSLIAYTIYIERVLLYIHDSSPHKCNTEAVVIRPTLKLAKRLYINELHFLQTVSTNKKNKNRVQQYSYTLSKKVKLLYGAIGVCIIRWFYNALQ